MKLWLDDERPAPEGWLWVKDYPETARYIIAGVVDEISLDHDLGDKTTWTGGNALNLIEELYVTDNFPPPKIHIHTQNPVARKWMQPLADKLNAVRD